MEKLKQKIKSILGQVECVLGWQKGFDALHSTPLFIKTPEDVEKLIIGSLCVSNLASYLYEYRGKKIGIIVKGCDSRSVIELIQEGLLKREDLIVLGVNCDGVFNINLIEQKIVGNILDITIDKAKVEITTTKQQFQFDKQNILEDKCKLCLYPNPLHSDENFGEKITPKIFEEAYPDLAKLDAMSLEERKVFFETQMKRCVRCYACRNACPLCICKDHCIATSRDPKWISQESNIKENLFFQTIHAQHLAGRCTECGECQRACPMGIPVLLFKRMYNRNLKNIFNYEAGVDPNATPPLLTFNPTEKNIKEREW